MRGQLFGSNLEMMAAERAMALQNPRLLRVSLDGELMAGRARWSPTRATSVRRTAGAGALIGRGSGEAFQLALSGPGFVVVQASEGPTVGPHSHGG